MGVLYVESAVLIAFAGAKHVHPNGVPSRVSTATRPLEIRKTLGIRGVLLGNDKAFSRGNPPESSTSRLQPTSFSTNGRPCRKVPPPGIHAPPRPPYCRFQDETPRPSGLAKPLPSPPNLPFASPPRLTNPIRTESASRADVPAPGDQFPCSFHPPFE